MAELANTPHNEPENEREDYNYIMLPRITNARWREGIYSVVGVNVQKTDEKYIYERDLLSDDEELESFASKHLFNLQMEYIKEENRLFEEKFVALEDAMEERREARRKKGTGGAGVGDSSEGTGVLGLEILLKRKPAVLGKTGGAGVGDSSTRKIGLRSKKISGAGVGDSSTRKISWLEILLKKSCDGVGDSSTRKISGDGVGDSSTRKISGDGVGDSSTRKISGDGVEDSLLPQTPRKFTRSEAKKVLEGKS
ncbi:circumsporozoite protein [Trichonephila clavata]|uniref:Circumsporozoite protein n=1 Tax=Trichonephila clavata TaxID=2740835 RepID=A0A8X6FJ89_TRICU|nr:circumsporozoite protein [Trichonephila clavata]